MREAIRIQDKYRLFEGEYLKDIPGYSLYQVSSYGRIWSRRRSRFIDSIKVSGYKWAFMKDDKGVSKWQYCHRITCTVFNGESSDTKCWVNHKDGIKGNNKPENLEWSTISENILHSYHVLHRKPNGFKKGHITTDNAKKLMSEAKKGERHPKFSGYYICNGIAYTSANQAAKALNTYPNTIHRRCKSGEYIDYSFIPAFKE